MRDLSDSLERENDLKEQLKFAEEENKIFRKKLSDLEEENESVNLQLQKLSSAKKFKKSDGDVVTEREHELRLQMELAEQEVKVLHRKLDEMEDENTTLIKQVHVLLSKVEGKLDSKGDKDRADDDRPYEERIQSMADDIENLKWKLIKKDTEADRSRGMIDSPAGQRKLKKSRSLDECSDDMSTGSQTPTEYHHDIRRQLETVEQEASVIRDKLASLETENERLVAENTKLEMTSNRRLPLITTDDAALKNIELADKLSHLEAENSSLRKQTKLLEENSSKLASNIAKIKSAKTNEDQFAQAQELRERLGKIEDEGRDLRKKMADLEKENSKLTRDLKKQGDSGLRSKDTRDLDRCTRDELKQKITGMQGEISEWHVFFF